MLILALLLLYVVGPFLMKALKLRYSWRRETDAAIVLLHRFGNCKAFSESVPNALAYAEQNVRLLSTVPHIYGIVTQRNNTVFDTELEITLI
jgi:hypothetical protein